jgi:hypothetical protein
MAESIILSFTSFYEAIFGFLNASLVKGFKTQGWVEQLPFFITTGKY